MNAKLEESTLYIAATRPALFIGVPLPVAGFFLMTAGFVIVLFKSPFYEIVLVPMWIGARILVARDYNAANVVFLWLRLGRTRATKLKVWMLGMPAVVDGVEEVRRPS